MRYGLDELLTAIRDPHHFLSEFNSAWHRRLYRWDYNEHGIDIHAEDWDNLIILDACRADAYREVAIPRLPRGQFETRESRAGATSEWIVANFSDRTLHDTVYVTGNSWIFKLGDEINAELHAVIDAKDDLDYHQERQVKKALEANREFPNKRLLVHLIPPHHPFLSPTAEKLLPPVEKQDSEFFRALRKGEVDIDTEQLWQIYCENLDRAIPAVRTLLEELPGKSVVSADHAELLGQRSWPIPTKEWGHRRGLYLDELVTVPWHIHDGDRKLIVADPPVDDAIDPRSPEEIDAHLKALGYKV